MTLAMEAGRPVAAEVDRWPRELVECYQHTVADLTGYLVTLVGDLGVAQDLAQEAFVRVFARWRQVEHPRAYVYMTAVNQAKMHWRRSGREGRAYSFVSRSSTDSVEAHDPWLRDLVERLPKRLRTPVLLHYYADLPVDEVAATLHLPVGTAKRRLHEARAILRDTLEDRHA
jgi:RNA polymerase sigma-70 factor (ECF subfamily)